MTTHPKPQKPPWKIDPSVEVNRVSLEDVKLIFSQAEKRLADTAKARESIESKTMTVVSLMTGILIALCGYAISNWVIRIPSQTKLGQRFWGVSTS